MTNVMAFQGALIKAVNEFGEGVLSEPRLLNILGDFHGFDEMPSARYILKALQKEGYLGNIIKIASYNQLKVEHISQKIHNRFGFDVSVVEQIVDQIRSAIVGLLLRVTQEDIEKAWTDGFGVKYHNYRLIQASHEGFTHLDVHEGTIIICNEAFSENGTLESISLCESVNHIGNGTFQCCQMLQSIYMPVSVISIGELAFGWCDSLQSIVLPLSLMELGNAAFLSCKNLQTISIPPKVTKLRNEVFSCCCSLHTVDLPQTLTHIGNMAFFNCSALITIIIPDTVKYIGDYAFCSCDNLQSCFLPTGVEYIGEHAFGLCYSLSSIYIPKGTRNHYESILPKELYKMLVEQ